MTVGQLKRELLLYPDELEICFHPSEGGIEEFAGIEEDSTCNEDEKVLRFNLANFDDIEGSWQPSDEAAGGFLLYNADDQEIRGEMLWWNPDSAGYTTDITKAGRYPDGDARARMLGGVVKSVPVCVAVRSAKIRVTCSKADLPEQHRPTGEERR